MTKSGLVRYLLLVGIILMISAASVSKAKADSIDLSGLADGNQGASLTIGGVTIKAKFGLSLSDDPLGSGNDGTVFKGTSGGKKGKGGTPFLGVQDGNGDGSDLISGGGKHEEEALTFTFSGGVSSISVTLVGFQAFDKKGNPKDVVDLYFSDGTFILNFSPIDSVLNFNLPSGSNTSFAIRASEGHFGVGGLSYSVVPEPATMLLLLTGLAGLGVEGRRRRRRRKS